MIPRLEPARQFIDRLVLLNRFHAPDEDDYAHARHVLGNVHRDFPTAPVHEQAAYLIERLSRERPFTEANFRTAWDYVADLLAHRGFDLQASYSEAQDLGTRVWEAIEAGDDAQAELAQWFRPRIHAAGRPS